MNFLQSCYVCRMLISLGGRNGSRRLPSTSRRLPKVRRGSKDFLSMVHLVLRILVPETASILFRHYHRNQAVVSERM